APWVFAQLKNSLARADNALKRSVVLEHFDRAIGFYGEYGVIIFRKHLHRYVKGCDCAAAFRAAINKESDPLAARLLIEEFFAAQ
ncbi:MAG: tRNA dihydrouridine synthase DusB, partial [Helicobacteraceae bacterium]|nr:tRNA dihydrouridine synthase DusB [Helicobacteraceae bacterium]